MDQHGSDHARELGPVLAKDQAATYRFAQATDDPTDRENKTSLTAELGYILAMETCFTGMSYLASRGTPYVRAIAGGFDLFMGTAGLGHAGHQKNRGKKDRLLSADGRFSDQVPV